MLFAVISGTVNWVPSYAFFYIILILGALITAGVAMSTFSFYDDYYWSDEDFRAQLRFHHSNRNSSSQKARKV